MGDPHNPAAVRAASQPAKFPRKFHGFFLLRFHMKFILQNCIFRLVAPSGTPELDSKPPRSKIPDLAPESVCAASQPSKILEILMDFFYYDFISNLYCKIAFFGMLRPVALWSRIPGAGDQDSGSGCPPGWFRGGFPVVSRWFPAGFAVVSRWCRGGLFFDQKLIF